jgi:hypothetical protein
MMEVMLLKNDEVLYSIYKRFILSAIIFEICHNYNALFDYGLTLSNSTKSHT